jgi:signal transduction histidine kinase
VNKKHKIGFVDIVKNIFRKGVYLLVIVMMVVFITISHYILHKYVFERFQDTMMNYVIEESTKVGKHISVHQDVTKQSEVMDIALEHIMEDFTINKIKLFDKDGYIIFSTKHEDIGTKNSHNYFYDNVQKGETYYKIVNAGETTLENVTIQKDVAEIYIPIMKNGIFAGASEIYYDISAKKYQLNKVIEQTDKLFMTVLTILFFIVLIMIYVASKNNILKQINDETSKELDLILQKQKRTTALGELIGNIAHHWRQPLSLITTVITGYKLRVDMGIVSDDELERTTNLVVQYANNLSTTIDRFRDFVVNANEQTEFFLDEVINNVLKNSKDILNNNQIEIKSDLESIKINGYEKEFTEVISNLLINSSEAFIKNNIEDRLIELSLKEKDGNIYITLKDNAGGVSEDIINKIFDPYFTTKHQFQGTGLGLFFCLKIIKEYFDGTIDCKNQEQLAGSIFTIIFPKNKRVKE